MRLRLLCLALAALALPHSARAMSQKSELTVRFHTETNPNDGEAFAIPVNLIYQKKQVYLCRIPDFSEKQIERILPFEAKDGSWGCVFKLTPQGRIRLETLSGQIRGAALVIFLATKHGHHQVADMIIDRTVTDGIITVPRGLTEYEVSLLKKEFKTIGAPDKKNWREKPVGKVEELPGGPAPQQPPRKRPSLNEPLSLGGPSRRRENPTLDLPRPQD